MDGCIDSSGEARAFKASDAQMGIGEYQSILGTRTTLDLPLNLALAVTLVWSLPFEMQRLYFNAH